MNFAYAGDRTLAIEVLEFILEKGHRPAALLLGSEKKASHATKLRQLCHFLSDENVLRGVRFKQDASIALLKDLDVDYLVCVHFPYIVPKKILKIPRIGVLNLHPAYLPYNRGWHTPSWAILDGTPYGATLHYMDDGVDTGPIVHQKILEIGEGETANSLYQKALALELTVFKEAWPNLVAGNVRPTPQDPAAGTAHKPSDLLSNAVRCIDVQATITARDLVRQLRALSTNRIDEASYYNEGDQRVFVRIDLKPTLATPTLWENVTSKAGGLLETLRSAKPCIYGVAGRAYVLSAEFIPQPATR